MSDPFVGTWSLNPARSTFDVSHRPRQASMRWELDAENTYILFASGFDATGEPCEEKPQRLRPDGVAYPVDGFSGLTSITTRPSPNTIRAEAKREDGSLAGEGTYVVADNGQTLTATTKGFDTQLRPFSMQTVWNRVVLAIALVASAGVYAEQTGPAPRPRYAQLLDSRHDLDLISNGKPTTTLATGGPPPNLVVPATHRSLVQTMWERSATFRRQCERIGNGDRLTVRLHLHAQRQEVASTLLVRRPGAGLIADVHLGQARRIVELFAHELEHIVERLEGLDVKQLARKAPDAVWMSDGGAYETKRAIQVGLTVASEVGDPRR